MKGCSPFTGKGLDTQTAGPIRGMSSLADGEMEAGVPSQAKAKQGEQNKEAQMSQVREACPVGEPELGHEVPFLRKWRKMLN